MEELRRSHDELRRTRRNPKHGSEERESENLQLQIFCGGHRRFSEPTRVDAAAKVDGDGGGARRRQSSSSSRVTRGRRQRERERRMRKAGASLFIREKVNRRARRSRKSRINGYPAIQAPRFSGNIKDKRSVGG